MVDDDTQAWRDPEPPNARPLWLALSAAGVLGAAVLISISMLAVMTPEPEGAGLVALSWAELIVAGVTALTVALGLIAAILRSKLVMPLRRLAAEAQFVAEARSDHALAPGAHPWLAPMPAAINRLGAALAQERDRRATEIFAATTRLEEQKQRLETILRDLSEGVLICTLDHRVLLYNHAALGLLHVVGELGLGRSLFNLIAREPVLHALERLLHSGPAPGERPDVCALVCATADATRLLLGRVSLTREESGRATGYVLTLTDATREVAELEARDRLLRQLGDGLRRPISNLHAAAQTLAAFPDMEAARRREFDAVVQRESAELVAGLAIFDRGARDLKGGHWPLADVLSLDIFRILAKRAAAAGGLVITPVGLPRWLHVDSQSLVVALQRIAERIAAQIPTQAIDLEAVGGERSAYLDFVWAGGPIGAATLDRWLTENLTGALGAATLGDVLQRHGSTIWSRASSAGHAVLRMPVPAAPDPGRDDRAAPTLPPRPEFYDFALLGQAHENAQAALQMLTFVVLDTETTGLKPSEGDEIVSIGAVRVVNRRILTGETFFRLVHPGRPIPPESTRYHGITDATVAGAPPAEVVLPQFRAFCADAVLVAHNAAFDLKFLRLRERAANVAFDMPVIDTLLLSAHLHPDLDDHDLDAIARRVGVPIVGRHTALGDALATAAVFAKLLELLAARGVDTLDELLEASRMAFKLRVNQASF